jgi:hypothetical protein
VPRFGRRFVLTCAVTAVAVACSSGGTSSPAGPDARDAASVPDAPSDGSADAGLPSIVGCDAGATASGCGYLTVSLQGGLTSHQCCFGCGSGTDGFSWEMENRISFNVEFVNAMPPLEQTGIFPIANVTLLQHASDGGLLQWQTPPGACTVTITRSVCVVTPTAGNDWLEGSGTCTAPAAPTAGNSGAPVTIGDFTFRNYVLMP